MLNTGGRDPAEIGPLIERLREPNPNTRRLARVALLEFGCRILPALERGLKDEDWELRRQIIITLGELGDLGAIPLLCRALRDWDWEVRSEAAAALIRLPDSQAAQPLVQGLSDEHYRVRHRCLQALVGLAEREQAAERDGGALIRAAAEPLCDLLRDSERKIRRDAAQALAVAGGREAVPSLIEALRDSDTEVRAAVAHTLVTLGDARAVLPLIAALNDQDMVRLRSAQALGCIAEREPTPGLEAALPRLQQLAKSARWGAEIPAEGDPYPTAIARIEKAIEHLRALPVPAEGPGQDLSQLPRPSGGAEADAARLPRPAAATAGSEPGLRRWLRLSFSISRILRSTRGILARREGRR